MGKPAARVGDETFHNGFITGPGCSSVLIGKLPAATVGDVQNCLLSDGPKPHGGGLITTGSMTVFIEKKPAARLGDNCDCIGVPAKNNNAIRGPGCQTVLIGD